MSDDGEKLTIVLASDHRDVRASVKGNAADEDSVEVTIARKGDAPLSRGPSRTVFWVLSVLAVLVAILFALLRRSKGDEQEGR